MRLLRKLLACITVNLRDKIHNTVILQLINIHIDKLTAAFAFCWAAILYITGIHKTVSVFASIPSAEPNNIHVLIAERNRQVNINGALAGDLNNTANAVIGAGGAARAVVASLLESGVTELRIANRTRIRAEQIKAEFGAKVVVYDWAQAGNMLEGAMTVVNATSMGMEGKPPLRVPLDALAPGTLVTDLVYTPLMTPFLLEAQSRGCEIVDGLGMLLHQGAPGFERWFGQRPEVDDALRQAVLA